MAESLSRYAITVDMDMKFFRHNNFTVLYMNQFINVDFLIIFFNLHFVVLLTFYSSLLL